MKNIGIIINSKRSRSKDTLSLLKEVAGRHSLQLFVEQSDMAELLGAKHIPFSDFNNTVDVVFAMGGDGTVLYAATKLIGTNIPILGINLGGLGFLAGVAEAELSQAINSLINKKYTILEREAASLSIYSSSSDKSLIPAFNDVVVGWGSSSRISTLRLIIDDEMVGVFTCDGIIISTPTGSTGHSLSNGGPILHPNIHGFGISVICPHTLSTRPLVVPNTSHIIIEVERAAKDLLISVDGHDQQTIRQGDRIEITKHLQAVTFMQLDGYSYFNTLAQKLNWRGSVL